MNIILALALSFLVLIALFGIDAFQVNGFEYLNTREVIVRNALACYDSNESSAGYGGFVYSTDSSKSYRHFDVTRKAIELLVQLGEISRINETAVLHFLNTTEIRVMFDDGYFHTYYADGVNEIYEALLTLKALDRLDLADSLVNASALHSMLVNQITHNPPGPMWANVRVAQLFGWIDELNKTRYAENLYNTALRFIMSNYGSPNSLGYGFSDFYGICNNLMALWIMGGVRAFTSDMIVITDFESLVRSFILLRWDSYNGGFKDDIGGYLYTSSIEPRTVVASVKASFTGLQLSGQIGIDLPSSLYGTEEWVNNAFVRVATRSQTKYGYFKSRPAGTDPTFRIDDNYYAVSLLTSANETHILDEGHFRSPINGETAMENLAKKGYLNPLITAIVVTPIAIVSLAEHGRHRKKQDKA